MFDGSYKLVWEVSGGGGGCVQHTAPHCTTLHHTTTQCNILQHTATHAGDVMRSGMFQERGVPKYNTLQHTATHCNTLQHTAIHCNTLQHTATHYTTMQHTAIHCNTLQHTATHSRDAMRSEGFLERRRAHVQHTATHCTMLPHTTTYCNTLQHTATHCNTLSGCNAVWEVSGGRKCLCHGCWWHWSLPVCACVCWECVAVCCSMCVAVCCNVLMPSVTRRIHMCGMTRLHGWYVVSICATWLIHTCGMPDAESRSWKAWCHI